MKSIIVGTAGHIDHGKTSLVKSLTGVDTDRLPEEKARGITIDLGFAHWKLDGVEISFIDVPGHERFVKNMLSGIGGIDLLLLIVAADESVKPQTREHFEICRLLQISRGIVVITKRDLVDETQMEIVKEDVRQLVRGSFLEGSGMFAVSSRTGDGLKELTFALAEQAVQIDQRDSGGIFRMPVDRVFTLKGRGTIVTGTLLSGAIQREQQVELMPSRRKSRVRSVHAHDESVDRAVAGQRTALNLQALEKDEVQRGDVVTHPDLFENTSLLDVKLTLLQNSKPLAHNALARLYHLASDIPVRITLLGREVLDPGESCFAQLRLQRPLFAVYGDRFILRRNAPPVTIGGGVILDHLPLKRIRRSDAAALQRLEKLETASTADRFSFAVAEKGIAGADESYLRAKLGLESKAIASLESKDVIRLRSNPLLALSTNAEAKIVQQIVNALQKHGKENPMRSGISKEELRTKLLPGLEREVFEPVVERGVSGKSFVLTKDVLSLPGQGSRLNAEDENFIEKVESELRQSGFEFPGMPEMGKRLEKSSEMVKKVLYLLVSRGMVIKVADDYFLHREVWASLKTRLSEMKSAQKTLSVPDFKTAFGVSRKFAIPLLELLDREGVTRRSGNDRLIL